MKPIRDKLTLVFSESCDPLIVDCSWSGISNREQPDLFKVGRGKPKLHAFCILFLLAKYRQILTLTGQPALIFAPLTKNGTWIHTLTNDIEGANSWAMKRFHIAADEIFFSCYYGTMHRNGNYSAHVEFKKNQLPLENVEFWVKPGIDSLEPCRKIKQHEYVLLASKMERRHWDIHVVEKLSGSSLATNFAVPFNSSHWLNKSVSSGSFLLASSDGQKVASRVAQTSKSELIISFRLASEKLMNHYTEQRKPLLSYLTKLTDCLRIEGAENPMTPDQVELWGSNGLYYMTAIGHSLGVLEKRRGEFKNYATPLLRSIMDRFSYEQSFQMVKAFFERRPAAIHISGPIDTFQLVHGHDMVIKEARLLRRVLQRAFTKKNPELLAGFFWAHQACIIDFICNMCWVFDKGDTTEAIAKRLYGSAAFWAKDILDLNAHPIKIKDAVGKFCETGSDFEGALRAANLIFKAYAKFWAALHRRFIELED